MELFKSILGATNDNPGVAYFANLIICLIATVWVYTSKEKCDHQARWLPWTAFWFFTAVYYFLELIPHCQWWIPYLSLDLSLIFLVIGLGNELVKDNKNKRLFIGIAFIIIVLARIADITYIHYNPCELAFFHQFICAVILVTWGWVHRNDDITQSIVIVTYGLMQLPSKQLIELFGLKTTISADEFVGETFLAYFLAKFALIVATYSLLNIKKQNKT